MNPHVLGKWIFVIGERKMFYGRSVFGVWPVREYVRRNVMWHYGQILKIIVQKEKERRR
jgi:hypothetical protein